MINSSILPKYSKVIYSLNPDGIYFTQSEIERQETPINRLPLELRIAPAGASNVKPNATKVLLSRECKNGKYKFITGIQDTSIKNWYLGNDYEFYRSQKIISIILFRFIENNTKIEVYYFHQFDKRNTFYRMEFAHSIIPLLNFIAA